MNFEYPLKWFVDERMGWPDDKFMDQRVPCADSPKETLGYDVLVCNY